MNTQSKGVDESLAEVVQAAVHESPVSDKASQAVIDFESIDLFSDETSDALIKAHNDALDGKLDESTVENAEVEAIAEDASADDQEAVTDAQNSLMSEPFFGFNNARSFMGSGQSMAGIVEGLRKPPIKEVPPQGAAAQALNDAGINQAGAKEDPRITLTLGRAALLMGGMGLAKLGGMIGGGGSLIGSGIGKLYNLQQDKVLRNSMDRMSSQIGALRNEGLGQLEDKGIPLDERQNIAKQFFAQPENKAQLEQLFEQANKVKKQARLMIEKGLKDGESPDSVMDRVLEPMRRFTEQNESFLESVKIGSETLLERMDGAMNSLFELLKQMVQRLAGALGMGGAAGAEPASSPRMG